MIVSTTLAGPGSEASIGDALRSCASLVDEHLILAPASHLEALAAAVRAAGIGPERTRWRVYEWPGSYGEARNAALRFAEEEGADWSLTVDSDERMQLERLELLPPGFDVLCIADRDRHYQKPRLLRCNAGLSWQWASAERLVGADGKPPQMARGLGAFWELPKTPEQEQARATRGVVNMTAVLEGGENAHARRHLAECLLILGRDEEAPEHFARVANDTEAASFERTWCRMRLAEIACLRGNYEQARATAALALAEDPGLIQELGWVMAHANAQLKNYTAAALWCSYVLHAPMDRARGGHRGMTWRDGATRLLASIEEAAKAQRPAFPFEGRAERFGSDYDRVAAALVRALTVSSHLDLGAGNGLLVRAMRAQGVASRGIEASTDAEAHTDGDTRRFIEYGVPLERWAQRELVGRPDLVSCVEVAEHIPADRAGELVAAICARSSRWIYFSAATPGQGGHGHVNEQPQIYWKALFADYGWHVDYRATDSFIEAMGKLQHCKWLKANAMLLRRF